MSELRIIEKTSIVVIKSMLLVMCSKKYHLIFITSGNCYSDDWNSRWFLSRNSRTGATTVVINHLTPSN